MFDTTVSFHLMFKQNEYAASAYKQNAMLVIT